ncbi:MAG TPA: PA14 domain-containing protein [Planctomycetota bacterium]
MGQEIFYCGACKTLLRTRDLEKGTAVRHEDHIFCAACAPVHPPPTPKAVKVSDSAIPRLAKTPRAGVTPGSPAKAPVGVIVAAVGGILAVLLLGILAAGGPKHPPRREEPAPSPVAATPVVEPPPRVVEPRPDPKPVSREPSARRLLEEARGFVAASPDNLEGGLERARRALLEAEGTSMEPDARRLEEAIKEKLKERRAALEARAKEALAAERFGEALAALEKLPDAAARVSETRLALDKAWSEVKDKLFAARKKGAQAEVKALAVRAEAWGVAPVRDELAKILASPVEVDPGPEVLAWRKKLAELPLPLDYAAALKELEKAPGAEKADLEALRIAAEIQRDIPLVFAKLKPGQDVRLERFDEAWNRVEVAGKILRNTGHELEIAAADERVSVPVVDVTPASWCELLKAPPRAAQMYRALEGDARDAAPPNILALGERLARALRGPPETAARLLFAEAEREFAVPTSRLGAAAKYQALSKDASTFFARRMKGVVDERLLASQEVVLGVENMTAAGQFVPSEALKGAPTVTMAGDSRGGESHLEIETTLGEATRAWVYAGACCLETFAIGLQTPDLTGPNPKDVKEQVSFAPGSPFALPLKVSTASLRAKHGHPGREVKWFWVPVPLPKASGPRAFRLVGEREGLSVAYVWLSVGRPGPPREADLKEFEKSRPAVEAAPVKLGTLLREHWLNVQSERITFLTSAPAYPDRPTGTDAINSFEGPAGFADNYGTRIRGYLHPPATGDYTFFVASDDDSELWLSLDETPARRRKIAAIVGSTPPRGWDHAEARKSTPIALKAGKRYYVELLHKDGIGFDHFAVGWQLPDGSMERPIPGNRLSPWLGPLAKGGRAFYRGINFNGPALTIDGQSWEGKDAPNVALSSHELLDNQTIPLIPPVSDGPKAQMIRASIWKKDGLLVTVSAVPPGRYFVYAYSWEDNGNEIFDILLNNRVVREKHNSGSAGQWARLGPWPVDVADGKIELRTTGPADANLSGLEIWRSTR